MVYVSGICGIDRIPGVKTLVLRSPMVDGPDPQCLRGSSVIDTV